jgi:hypothetical protein
MNSEQKKLEYNRLYRKNNRLLLNQKAKERKLRYKKIVLDKYGNSCKWCSFSDMRALQIDHINDNGAEERKSLGGQKMSGWVFYEYLIKSGLPDGYQTLCANCNNIKQWNRNNKD